MKKIILLLFAISLFQQFTSTQWVQQTSGVTTSLLDIDFINENTGWACGDGGVIVKTTNGGINWVQQFTGVANRLEGIDAIDANLVWSVGWWNTILKTTDGGGNWQIIRSEPTPVPTFRKVYFLNANTGWLLKSNYILRTTNGGVTFDSTHTVFTYLWDVYFKNSLTGVLSGDGALIMRSTDGGIIWNQINLPLFLGAPNLYRISFIGDNGWTIGSASETGLGKLVFKTTNFGSTWDSIARVPYPNSEQNYSVFFTNLNIGYAGGESGYIYKTTNGGFNWLRQNSPSNAFRNDFWFANDTIGWSAGGGGQIFKTSNGGTFVKIEPLSHELPKEYMLNQNYPNPFNPSTQISYSLPHSSIVTVKVFNAIGQVIATLADNEYKDAGGYSAVFDGTNFASGIYFYSIEAGVYKDIKKMVLIK